MNKQSLLSPLLLFLPLLGVAQHVNGVPLDSINAPYMELIVRTGYFSEGLISIDLDYGQQPKLMNRIAALKNYANEPLQFNSAMDALGFMRKYGYVLDQIYVTGETNGDVNYILRRDGE